MHVLMVPIATGNSYQEIPAPSNSYIFLDLTTKLKLSYGVRLTSFEKIAGIKQLDKSS